MLRLAVPIPVDATATQLGAVAALAAQLGQGRWEDLSRSFAQLDQRQASVPEPMAELLGELAAGLRRAADDREQRATA
jgi:hypothetical protein